MPIGATSERRATLALVLLCACASGSDQPLIPKEPVAAGVTPGQSGDVCASDSDCEGDLVCDAGACIPWWKMKGEIPELSAAELEPRIERGEIQVLDVRTAPEFRAERIEGAVHVPLGDLPDRIDDLPLSKDKPVVAVCLTAHRSMGAVRLLQRHGYDAVQLQGGMNAWRKAGMPRVGGSENKPTKRRARGRRKRDRERR